jgi:threonylcarbamoyladenosine tRNA methylthiotransferase MtaB
VFVRTLGCKVNRAESEAIAAELLGEGVRLVAEDEASVIVVNTCTVTGEADAKARKAVRRALAAPRSPVVVATGCLAAVDREGLEGLGDRVVVSVQKSAVGGAVRDLLAQRGEDAAQVASGGHRAEAFDGATAAPQSASRSGAHFRSRVAVKVQDGCDCACTYCIVPRARGASRSVALRDVLAEVAALVDAGVREVVLTGINVGRYRDAESGACLPQLLAKVAATGVSRVRLSSVEPMDLTDEFLGVVASLPTFCAHLHVPLQSGSDAVLSAMGRTYRAGDYADRISAARAVLPQLAVTTDVIAGFPGESAEQAAETLEFCERIGFSKLHVFRYSARSGTLAADMPDRIPPSEIDARASALRMLSERLEVAHAASRVGLALEVLVERRVQNADGTAQVRGTSREYLQVSFGAGGASLGDVVTVVGLGVDGRGLVGKAV